MSGEKGRMGADPGGSSFGGRPEHCRIHLQQVLGAYAQLDWGHTAEFRTRWRPPGAIGSWKFKLQAIYVSVFSCVAWCSGTIHWTAMGLLAVRTAQLRITRPRGDKAFLADAKRTVRWTWRYCAKAGIPRGTQPLPPHAGGGQATWPGACAQLTFVVLFVQGWALPASPGDAKSTGDRLSSVPETAPALRSTRARAEGYWPSCRAVAAPPDRLPAAPRRPGKGHENVRK